VEGGREGGGGGGVGGGVVRRWGWGDARAGGAGGGEGWMRVVGRRTWGELVGVGWCRKP